jgi:hypothetical protein
MRNGLFSPANMAILPRVTDADAAAYIAAVTSADQQILEAGVQTAINDFVVGCKADGIWDAIKASCIMAGARTLSGALVPLKGAAPTNFNFVSGDYNRKTGLIGNGSTKYLDSNRAGNADPQNNNHVSVMVSTAGTVELGGFIWQRVPPGGIGETAIYANSASGWPFRSRLSGFTVPAQGTRTTVGATGLIGASRSASGSFISRVSGSNETITSLSTSVAGQSGTYGVFALFDGTTASFFGNHRASFYSIGEALDLALLDTRVSALMTAIDGAIP